MSCRRASSCAGTSAVAATLALAMSGWCAPTATATEREGFRVTIAAPERVQVADRFRVRVLVEPTLPGGQAVLDASLIPGTECSPDLPESGIRLATSRRISELVSIDETPETELRPGDYRVCVYLAVTGPAGTGFTNLFDSAPIRIAPLRPSREKPWTLTTDGRFVLRLGPLAVNELAAPDLDYYLGAPPIKRRLYSRGEGCNSRWPAIGLNVYLLDLGGGSGCGADSNVADFSIGGRSMYERVKTSGGLRLGDRVSSIRRSHPQARRRSRSVWLLKPYRAVIGTGTASALSVTVRNGRVHWFGAYVGAAGD